MIQVKTDRIAYIDGVPHEFEAGETMLNFIDRHLGRGHVPTLCDAPQLEPYGACRVCSVEVAMAEDGPRRVVASCHTPLSEGMHIFTESGKVRRLRKNIVELVLTDHPLDCLTCEVNGNCELQTVAAKVGIRDVRYPAGRNHLDREKDLGAAYMTSDLSKCINCSRCVRACDEVQGQFVLSMHGRGFDARIIKGLDQSFKDSTCVSCGACSQACPTSAISDIFASKSIEATESTRTVCTYCGVGCNLDVKTKGNEILSITAPVDAEVNHAHTCLKGRYAFKFYNHPDRLRTPLIRRNGTLRRGDLGRGLRLYRQSGSRRSARRAGRIRLRGFHRRAARTRRITSCRSSFAPSSGHTISIAARACAIRRRRMGCSRVSGRERRRTRSRTWNSPSAYS